MRTLGLIVVTAALLTATSAVALCTALEPVQIGSAMVDSEKDTFGLVCDTADVGITGSIGNRSDQIMAVGVSSGDPEKDTVGYVPAEGAQ